MAIETSQIKFAKSEETGELIGFVSRHSKTKKLKGVRENSAYGKQICVLSEDLKGGVLPNVLYQVELKAMHNSKGFVVISATPVQFDATFETIVVRNALYQITISFGNKIIYFDPKDGKSPSSKSIDGVLSLLASRADIKDLPMVLDRFKDEARSVLKIMEADGYYVNKQSL